MQWCSNITQSFHYLFGYKHVTQVIQSFLPQKLHLPQQRRLEPCLPHSSSDHALLVVVDVINHMFSLTEELVKGVRRWVINLGLKRDTR